jgi:hypothetical protein
MTDIPQAAVVARRMYGDGDSVADILAETKLPHDRLYYWLDGGPGLLPPLPRRRMFGRGIASASQRIALIGRMMRAAERQVQEIEQRLAAEGLDAADQERDARALAVLARTLRDLTALDALNRSRKKRPQAERTNDQPIPRNVDELRRSLLQKLENLVAEQQSSVPEAPDA